METPFHLNPPQTRIGRNRKVKGGKYEAQQEEIQFLRQQLQETCTEKDKQIEELHQLVAMTQKSVNQLTAQNQLLLEDTQQQPSFWQRIKSHFAEA